MKRASNLKMSRLIILLFIFLTIAAQGRAGIVKIVCIGDSITAGRYYNWRYHLALRLEREGYSQLRWVGSQKPTWVDYRGDYPSAHEGYYGATAIEVAGFCEGTIEKEKPDVAIIDLGTNDISQKKKEEESAEAIGRIIDHLRTANPNSAILLCLIPHPAGPGRFNRALEAMAKGRQNPQSPLILVNLAKDWNDQPDADTYDWVHPNLRGALKISDRLHDALVRILPAPESAPMAVEVESPRHDLAAGKPVRASAELGGKAAWAVDGDPMTMWEATPVSTQPLIAPEKIVPQWLEVDLGGSMALEGSGIVWDIAGASYDYTLEVSEDRLQWTPVVVKTNNTELSVALKPETDRFDAHGRFVRVTVTGVPNVNFPNYRTGLPAAIREFHVYEKD